MKQLVKKVSIKTDGINFYEITQNILNWLKEVNVRDGILNISILHTSASLLIQENADPAVLKDLKNYFIKLAPFSDEYLHQAEGKDDMPAHIKTSLTNTNLTLSILNKKLCLGTWQGIYLLEHRFYKHNRLLVYHFIGK